MYLGEKAKPEVDGDRWKKREEGDSDENSMLEKRGQSVTWPWDSEETAGPEEGNEIAEWSHAVGVLKSLSTWRIFLLKELKEGILKTTE